MNMRMYLNEALRSIRSKIFQSLAQLAGRRQEAAVGSSRRSCELFDDCMHHMNTGCRRLGLTELIGANGYGRAAAQQCGSNESSC